MIISYCGDGICQPFENCLMCSQDCGQCPTTTTSTTTTTIATTTTTMPISTTTTRNIATTTTTLRQVIQKPNAALTQNQYIAYIVGILIIAILLTTSLLIVIRRRKPARPSTIQKYQTTTGPQKYQTPLISKQPQMPTSQQAYMTFGEKRIAQGMPQSQILEEIRQRCNMYPPETIYELNGTVASILKKGYTLEQIKQQLREKGWDEAVIRLIFEE